MKKIYWIVGIAIIVLVGFGILVSNQQMPTKSIIQSCSNEGNYCKYNNIPQYLMYTSPTEQIPEELRITQEILNQYLQRKNLEPSELNEIFGLDPEKWACQDGGQILEVKYFYELCEEGLDGCGYNRKAFLCDEVYFIEQYSDTTGPVLYGPFPINS